MLKGKRLVTRVQKDKNSKSMTSFAADEPHNRNLATLLGQKSSYFFSNVLKPCFFCLSVCLSTSRWIIS